MKKLITAAALAAIGIVATSASAAISISYTVDPNVNVGGINHAKFVFFLLNDGNTTASTGSTTTGILAGQLRMTSSTQPQYDIAAVDAFDPSLEVKLFVSELGINSPVTTTTKFESSLWSLAGNPSLDGLISPSPSQFIAFAFNPTLELASFNANLVQAGPSKNGGRGLAFLTVVARNTDTAPVITLTGRTTQGPSFDVGQGQTINLPSAFVAVIPEPAALGVVAATALTLLRRRRRA